MIYRLIGLAALVFTLSPELSAQVPSTFVYQGQILQNGTTPLEVNPVIFTVKILSPGVEACVLYEEQHSINMIGSNGVFSLNIGAGMRSGSNYENSSNLQTVFSNASAFNSLSTCVSGNSYTPLGTHTRKMRVSYFDGATNVTLNQDHHMQATPYSWYANSLQGLTPTNFVQVRPAQNLTQANLENVFGGTNYTSLLSLLAGSSPLYVAAGSTGARIPGFTTTPSGLSAGSMWYDSTLKQMRFYDGTSVQAVGGDGVGNGTITEITAGSGLDGGTITTTGTISVANDGITSAHILDGTVADVDLASGIDASKITTGMLPSSVVPEDTTKLSLSGGTMTGDINMDGHQVLATGHITMSPLSTVTLGKYNAGQQTSLVGALSNVNQGAIWFNSDTSSLIYWDGSAAQVVSNQATAGGDITEVNAGAGMTGGGVTGAVTLSVDLGTAMGQLFTIDQVPHCASNQKLEMANGPVYGWSCVTDNDSGGDITEVNTTAPLAGGGTTGALTLSIGYDNTSVGMNGSSQLEVKAGGIAASHLAADSVVTAKIQDAAVVDAKIASVGVDKITSGVGKYFTYLPNNAACTNGQVLKWNNADSRWECGDDDNTNLLTSVFGRTGAVVATAGDYTAAQVTNVAAGNIAATTVQSAVNELDTEKLAKAGDTMTGQLTMASPIAMNAQNEVRFGDSDSSNYVALRAAGTVSSNVTWTLPAADGTGGQVLSTNGSGVMSWIDMALGDITGVVTNTGSGLSGGAASGDATLQVVVDNSTVEIATNSIQVKDAGITAAKLAADSVTSAKIVDGTIVTADIANGAVTDAKIDTVSVSKIISGVGQYLTYQPNNAACTDGQTLKWSNSNSRWECGTDNDAGGDITGVTAGTGLTGGGTSGAVTLSIDFGTGANQVQQNMDIPNCLSTQKLQMSAGPTYTWTCETDNDSGGDITAVNTTAPLSGGGATGALTLSIGYDNSSIGINGSSQLEVKAGGIAASHLATDSVVTAKIQNGAVSDAKIADVGVDKITSGVGKYFTYLPNNAACTNGQTLKWSTADSRWECGDDDNTNLLTSVFGRTGAVVATAGDYTAAQVTNVAAGNIAATTVQAAVNELDTEKLNKSGDTMSGQLTMTDNITMNAQNEVRFADANSSNYVALRAAANVSSDVTWTLPGADGTAGQVLATDGLGVLSWTDMAAGDITGVTTNSGSGLSGGVANGNATLQVVVDGSTVEISTNTIQVKDAGITAAKLAADSVTSAKIVDGTIVAADIANGAVTDAKIDTVSVSKIISGVGQYLTYLPNNAACTDGQTLKWNNADSRWECGTDNDAGGDITGVTAGTGLTGGGASGAVTLAIDYGTGANQVQQNMDIPSCLPTQKLQMSAGPTYTWTCETDNDAGGDITAVNTTAPLSGGGTTGTLTLSIGYDNSSIGVNGSSQLEVKAGGIAASHLATDSVVNAKIQDAAVTDAKIADVGVDKITSGSGKYFTYLPNNAACTNGQTLKWSTADSRWECGDDDNTNLLTSVFGRTGAVVATAGDYTAAQITNTAAGNIAATTVQAAVNELDTEKLNKSGDTMSGSLTMTDNIVMNAQSEVRFADSNSSNYVALRAAANVSSDVTWTLPGADGTTGQVLATDGSGVLSWTDMAAGDITGVATNSGSGLSGGVANGNATLQVVVDGSTVEISTNTIQVKDAGITATKLAADSVTSAKIVDGTITSADLANSAVTDAKIADVGVDKISSGAGKYLTYLPNNVACTNGQVLKWNNTDSRWECGADDNAGGDITEVTAGTGLTGGGTTGALTLAIDFGTGANQVQQNMDIPNCLSTQKLQMSAGPTYTWTCETDNDSGGDITAVNTTAPLAGGGTTGALTLTIGYDDSSIGMNGSSQLEVKASGITDAKIANVGVDKIASGVGKYFTYLPNNAACSNGQTLKWSTADSRWECGDDDNTNLLTSVFGRTGAVVATAGDYTAAQITNTAAGNIAATTVQAAVNELDTEKLNKSGDTMSGQLTMTDNITMNAQNEVRFADANSSNYVALRAPANVSSNVTWTLPTDDGTSGQVLATDGSGALSWLDMASGDITGVNTNAGSGLSGGAASGDATLQIVVDNSTIEIATNSLQIKDGGVSSAKIANSAITDAKIANVGVDKISSGAGKYLTYLPNNVACTNGQVLKWNNADSRWECGADDNAGGDITEVTAGTGLTGGGATGALTLAIDFGTGANQVQQNMDIPSCLSTQKLQMSAGPTYTWTCETDNDAGGDVTAVNTTAPLSGGGTSGALTLSLGYDDSSIGMNGSNQIEVKASGITDAKIANVGVDKITSGVGKYFTYLPNNAACTNGQVLKWDNGNTRWICGDDDNTNLLTSVFGRTGAVVATAGDYTAAQVTNVAAGNIAATTAQAAINELDTEKVAKAGDAMTGALTMNAQSEVRFADSNSSNYVALRAPANVSSDITWTLPAADGTSGQVLATDGSGALSWSDMASGDITGVTTGSGSGLSGGAATGNATLQVVVDNSSIEIATNTIQLKDAGISSAKLATDSVVNSKIQDGAVTDSKIASVGIDKITSGAGKYLTYLPNNVACTNGQVLKWNNADSRWECGADENAGGDITAVTAGTGLTGGGATGALTLAIDFGTGANQVQQNMDIPSCLSTQKLQMSAGPTYTWTCETDNDSGGDITAVNTSAPLSGGGTTGALTLSIGYDDASIGMNGSNQLEVKANGITDAKIAAVGVDKITSGSGKYFTYLPNNAACTNGQVLKWDNGNTRWICGDDDNNTNLLTSVFGRTGVVVATAGDYTAAQITNTASGNIAATTVQAALNELDTEKLALAGGALTGAVTTTSSITMNAQNEVRFADSDSSNYIALRSPATVGSNVTFTLPATDGTGGQVLSTNGSGTLSWLDMASGDITGVTTNSGSGLSGGAASGAATLQVVVDNSSIEIATNTIQLKDGGVATAKIANSAITDAKIADVGVDKITSGSGKYFSYLPNNAACTNGQTLKWSTSNSRWECGTDNDTGDITGVTAGTGLIGGGTSGSPTLEVDIGTAGTQLFTNDDVPHCSSTQKLEMSAGPVYTWSCVTDANSGGDITAVTTTAPLSGGATSGAVSLTLLYDNLTIGLNGSNELEVKDSSISGTKLAASSISSSHIVDGTIASGDLAGSSVTSAKIADGTIATADMADGAVTDAKIASIDVSKIINASGSYFTYQPNNTACTNGQVLKWSTSNSRWECGVDSDSGDITAVTAGAGLTGGGASGAVSLSVDVGTGASQFFNNSAVPHCSATEKLQMSAGPVYSFSCISDSTSLSLQDTDGDTRITVEAAADEDTIRFRTSGNERMQIDASGFVGIGTAPTSERLRVNGDIRLGTSGSNGCVLDAGGGTIMGSCSSDARFKKNIQPLGPISEKLAHVAPKFYQWRSGEFPQRQFGNEEQLGLIAQEVLQFIPDLVEVDEKGFYRVKYHHIPFYLLQGFAEQHREVSSLKQKINTLEEENKDLKKRLDAIEKMLRMKQ